MDALPNFFVIGAMRSATTSLCDMLALHPQVFMSTPKELDFFSNDEVFARGFDWYRGVFANANGAIAIGEGSTNYTKQSLYPQAAERLAKYRPEAKLIYIARHPLRRIESHWLHLLREGHELPTLAEAIRQRPEMIDISLYWKQIGAYRGLFADKCIHVVFAEDLQIAPESIIARVCEFLGIDADADVAQPHLRSNAYPDVGVDGAALRLMRKLPGAQMLASLQPPALREVWRKLKKPQPEPATAWPDELRAQVVRKIEADTHEFLAFYGKPADYWRMDA